MTEEFTHTLVRLDASPISGIIRGEGDPIPGYYNEKPTAGLGFRFYGEGVDFGTRLIYTSDVAKVEGNRFTTQSGSVYELKEIEDGR